MANEPINTETLLKVFSNNKATKQVASKFIESNKSILPIASKLIRDRTLALNIDNKNYSDVNRGILQQIHDRLSTVSRNNKNIIKLFPDVELSIQIIVSSILSPKKMTDSQHNYKFKKKFNMDPSVSNEVLTIIREYIEDTYNLEDKSSEMVREALAQTGAYVLAIVPEGAVDEIINSDLISTMSQESYKRSIDSVINILVKPLNLINPIHKEQIDIERLLKNKELSTESFAKYLLRSDTLNITDNIGILNFGAVKEKVVSTVIKKSMRSAVGISTESMDKINYLNLFRQRNPTDFNINVKEINTRDKALRKSLGKPMSIKLPTESVIPVFVPGSPSDHKGYLVLLDDSGKPLSSTNIDQRARDTFNGMDFTNTQQQMSITQKAYKSLIDETSEHVNVDLLFNMYKGILEKQLYDSISGSLYGTNVDIGNVEDIYFLMFTRALSEQNTNILYLPVSNVMYLAFNYTEAGVGETLLENLSILMSLRAIGLFSKVMANAKQAIDVTKVNISLDPNDPDPEKTLEEVKRYVYAVRQNTMPAGILDITDITTWIQRAGIMFNVDNNPRLPNIKIDYENSNLQHTVPSGDMDDDLRKQCILGMGLSPETVDNSYNAQFATTEINNSVLMNKRISLRQKTYNQHLSKLVSMIIYNDEVLRSMLKKHFSDKTQALSKTLTEEEKTSLNTDKDKFIEYYLDNISENIHIELPKPDNTDITSLTGEYDLYTEAIDKTLNSVISSEIFTDNVSGITSGHVDTIRNLVKHQLLREWMISNNYVTETLDITNVDIDEVQNTINKITNHLGSTMRNSIRIIKDMQSVKDAGDQDLSTVEGSGASSSIADSAGSEEDTGEEAKDSDLGKDLSDTSIDF